MDRFTHEYSSIVSFNVVIKRISHYFSNGTDIRFGFPQNVFLVCRPTNCSYKYVCLISNYTLWMCTVKPIDIG